MGIIKRKKTKVDEIILGIDIGTQFSYLGYIADGKFVECIPEGASKYGISSTIAWKNNGELLFGFEADDELQKDGSGYAKESISAKTAVRKYGFQEEITMSDGRKFSPKVYLEGYVAYLQKKYNNCANKKKIKKIAVAFPDIDKRDKGQKNAVGAYKNCLRNAVKKAFHVKNVDVVMNSEAAMAADLIAKLYYAQNIQEGNENYNDIMVIDIGAGTSDIGIARWNGEKYEIKIGDQASVNFGGDIIDKILTNKICDAGGNQVLPSQTPPVALIKYKKWIFGDGEQSDDEILKIDAYRSDDPIKQKELLQSLRSKIVSEKQYTDGAQELWNAINNLYTNYTGSKRSESQLEVVVLGNTSTIKPVRKLIKNIFPENGTSVPVHFLDDNNELSNALRQKGVTNSNFMAFACAFVGGGINTKDINDIKILNANETEKNETSLQVADPTIHSASSIFAINVNHKITEPFFNAWDLISSPFAQEGEKYFLVGPYVSTSNGEKELLFKSPEIKKLIFKKGASKLEANNPNSNFLITYRIDKGNKWISDEKPEYDASGNMYYSYDDYVEEAMSSSKDIEIVGYGYSNDKKFPDNEGYYIGTIYNYSPAAPVDKKLQIYFWKQTDKQTGGECYYDKKNQKKIDFETFRNEAIKDGRCNLYD